jgi:hypothetical protein
LTQRAKDQTAQRIFELAERHRRSGEYDVARKLYQQVHLFSPTTLHGRIAITRIIEVEERMREVERIRDASEEQQIPGRGDDPEQAFRDMHQRTVPLGLVRVSY